MNSRIRAATPAAIGVATDVLDLRCSKPFRKCLGHADRTASPTMPKLCSLDCGGGVNRDPVPYPSVELIQNTR